MYDLAFPHLNIYIEKMISGFNLFGLNIAFYGVIIAIGMLCGFYVAIFLAKKSNQNVDNYYDLFIFIIIFAIIGARIYYVAFNLDYYLKNVGEIVNIRAGGLAVYGGIIACFIIIYIFSRIKKINFFQVVDNCIVALTIGQVIGRWGNFFNMEAFGTYTDNLFAMQMKYDLVNTSNVDQLMLNNIKTIDGVQYVQAHPTFLYESFFNLLLFIVLILIFFKFYKFYAQLILTYFIGYGLIRFFVEGLRTDSLLIPNTDIRVSQVLSIVLVFVGIIFYIYNLFVKQKIKYKNIIN